MLDDDTLARTFRALAHPARARIFRLLAAHPEAGDSFETLSLALGLAPSAVTPHLREMERCEIICRQRRGGHTAFHLCTADFNDTLRSVLSLGEQALLVPLEEDAMAEVA